LPCVGGVFSCLVKPVVAIPYTRLYWVRTLKQLRQSDKSVGRLKHLTLLEQTGLEEFLDTLLQVINKTIAHGQCDHVNVNFRSVPISFRFGDSFRTTGLSSATQISLVLSNGLP